MFWKRRNKTGVIIFFIVSVICFGETTAEEYWKKLHEKASKAYSVANSTVNINTGEDEVIENVIRVPIYSKEQKALKEKEKNEFLEKGSKLISVIETNRTFLEKLKKKEGLLKSMMTEQGIQGINAYYDCVDEIVKREQEVKEAERALDIMVK